MTDAELRALLADCLKLWNLPGTVAVEADGVVISTPQGRLTVCRADPALHPVRFLYQTPARAQAGRPPRAAPSVVALLSAVRIALDGAGGQNLRVGGA